MPNRNETCERQPIFENIYCLLMINYETFNFVFSSSERVCGTYWTVLNILSFVSDWGERCLIYCVPEGILNTHLN